MARPKVPDDKRQRTAQACNICKRRKQKCNGKTPCNTCTKKELSCEYTPQIGVSHQNIQARPSETNRRPTKPGLSTNASGPSAPQAGVLSSQRSIFNPVIPSKEANFASAVKIEELPSTPPSLSRTQSATLFHAGASSETEEETEIYKETRMLEDPTGRLLYVGDSATLSFLQLVRMIVETCTGRSEFTMDPNRFKIAEATSTIPPNLQQSHILPDRDTARVLADSYFTNTHGLVEIFDREVFLETLDACYRDSPSIDTPFLCLVYLTMAIGLVMATSVPGTRAGEIIEGLRAEPYDASELLFHSARRLGNPLHGFEDADFWSVQALSLMSIYMLAVSKRNAAYAYCGMAVRAAFSLGMHRSKDTSQIFDDKQIIARQNVWRSLFVLDRFLAASLGRPTAISEEDCSDGSLDACPPLRDRNSYLAATSLNTKGLSAAVRASQSIGCVLKRIYSKRRVTTNLAQKIAGDCEYWMNDIDQGLDPNKLFKPSINSADGMAILHVQLLGCHAIILLTRPFFLYLLSRAQMRAHRENLTHWRSRSRLEKFSETCVAASIQTILLVHAAYKQNYVSQRNPFILYFLFAASLVVMSNEFAGLFRHGEYTMSVSRALEVTAYCSQTDLQANRLFFILNSFQDVIKQHAQSLMVGRRIRLLRIDMSRGSLGEPLANLAAASRRGTSSLTSEKQPNSASASATASKQALKTHTDSPPLISNPAGPRTAVSQVPGPNFVRGPSVGSSNSSHTSSTKARLGNNGPSGSEGDHPDSLPGEQEVDFDCFWAIPSSTQTLPHQPLEVLTHNPPTQGPGIMPLFRNPTISNPNQYATYPPPGYPPHIPSLSTSGPTMSSHIPMYPPGHFS